MGQRLCVVLSVRVWSMCCGKFCLQNIAAREAFMVKLRVAMREFQINGHC